MNNVKVRCWSDRAYDAATKTTMSVFITYPEDNIGHDLVICANCGQIYAIDISKEIYKGPPRSEKLRGCLCIKCGAPLGDTALGYPEKYRADNGQIKTWKRPQNMPNDNDSMVKEFPGIY